MKHPFKLEEAVERWRERADHRSSLTPSEVEELEDHLRARVDLELELDPGLASSQAFATASEELGEPRALSIEFVKGGRPRWRRLLLVGWALFAVSFVLPAVGRPWTPPPPPGTSAPVEPRPMFGREAFLDAVVWGDPVGKLSAVTNLLIVLGPFIVRRSRRGVRGEIRRDGEFRPKPGHGRWLRSFVTGAASLNLVYWPLWMIVIGDSPM